MRKQALVKVADRITLHSHSLSVCVFTHINISVAVLSIINTFVERILCQIMSKESKITQNFIAGSSHYISVFFCLKWFELSWCSLITAV